MPYEQNKPAVSILDSKPDTYQGTASPHSVMVKHINAVLAAEHRHMVEYQREREQHEAERRARHARERAEMAAQGYTRPVVLPTTNFITDDNSTFEQSEDTDMNLKQLAAAAAIASSLTTSACSQEELNQPRYNSAGEKIVTGEAFDITKNPNPQKAYKLKVKINGAPGEFKSARAVASFDIGNIKECGYYLGGAYQGTVPGVERDIEFPLIQLSDTEYEGVFYTDWGKDGDFFGKGVCHWVFTYAGVAFKATGDKGETQFVAGFNDKYDHKTREHVVRGTDDEFDPKQPKSKTRFYLKEFYPKWKDQSPTDFAHPDNGITEAVARKYHKPEALFSITLTTEEIY